MIYITIGIGLICIAVVAKVEKRKPELRQEIAEIREMAKNYDTY